MEAAHRAFVLKMNDLQDQENRAGIARVTCGWKLAHLPLEVVRRYWRDVHSPGIARRPGLYEYRHLQFDPVITGLFEPIADVRFDCPAGEQLMWTSDVRYLDQAGVATFSAEPPVETRAHLLGDINLIVDQSTTYLVLGTNARTTVDRSGDPAPQGPAKKPTYSLFLRQRNDEAAFRACLTRLVDAWGAVEGVVRVRLALFEVPDLEAERKAGYPIKTHPLERQYQAWIDLTVDDDTVARSLLQGEHGSALAAEVRTLHAYPTPVVYTSVCRGKPTLVGLRGYAAHLAIEELNALNQKQPALLEWMYGDVAKDAFLP